MTGRLRVRQAVEEEGYRNLEDIRKLLHPACPDAIGSGFVLLNLLISDSNRLAERLLAHVQHQPARAHTTTNMFVYWILQGLLPHDGSSHGRYSNTYLWSGTVANPRLVGREGETRPIATIRDDAWGWALYDCPLIGQRE